MADDLNTAVPKASDPNVALPKTPDPIVPPVKTPDPKTLKQKFDWYQNLPTFLYMGIAIAMLAYFGVLLKQNNGILQALADKEKARGLITVLIAVTTMGIAIILAISTLFGKDGDGGDQRFDRGKQVLSVLIGLLGTIVGFYYGAETKAPVAEVQRQALAIATPNFDPPQPKKGEPFTTKFSVSGGTPPYVY